MRLLGLTILLFLLIPPFTGTTQNTGYAGKRIMLNIDAVSGTEFPRYGGSIQYLLGRHSTVSLGYSIYNQDVNQRYYQKHFVTQPLSGFQFMEPPENYLVLNNPEQDFKKEISDLGRIETQTLSLEYSFYFDKSLYPAPRGAFLSAAFQYHTSSVSGNYYKSMIKSLDYEQLPVDYCASCPTTVYYEPDEHYRYTYGNIQTLGWMLGGGYTYFITNNLTITASAYFHYMDVDFNNEYNNSVFSGTMRNNFGPNLSYGDQSGSIISDIYGISGFIKVGYLIF